MRLVGRCHTTIARREFYGLLTTLYARPTIPPLYKICCSLALIILYLKTCYVRCKPMDPCKAACYRISVLVLLYDRK